MGLSGDQIVWPRLSSGLKERQRMGNKQSKICNASSVERGEAVFNAANIAEEIRGAIKEAMAETIAQAIEYKMAERESNDSEHANLLVLLAKQNKSQRKEIETLTQAMNDLKQEVKTSRWSREVGQTQATTRRTPVKSSPTRRGNLAMFGLNG